MMRSKILVYCWFSMSLLPFYASSLQEQEFTYLDFSDSSIILNGSALLIDDGSVIRLTDSTSFVMGHAFHPVPIRFKETPTSSVSSFSTAFIFSHVSDEFPHSNLGGHGLAIAFSPNKDLSGALPSQYLGLLSLHTCGKASNHLFAVEFDTVMDPEFDDINDNHVGINLNSMVSNSSAPAAYYADNGTMIGLSLTNGGTLQAWVDYDGDRKLLNVTLAPTFHKPDLPILSYNVDLAPTFLDTMYVGFSASTGTVASSHHVFSWSLKMNGAAPSLDRSSLPELPILSSHRHNKKKTIFEYSTVAATASAALLIAAAGYIVYKVKKADVIEPWELEYGPHRYPYEELKRATKGFREFLGSGGFGKVYKGTLPGSGLDVAVKRVSSESRQGLREFLAEIASIGRLRHRNLVQLQGWCRRRSDLLLVYEYMPNSSLDRFLFAAGGSSAAILSWAQRFRIIRGVAAALLYLHEEWESVVIHRDVKASNVLLDADLNGRLGDFGLAKLYEHGDSPSTTRVVGTLGYLAPELTRTGRPTTGSDVYAFGALMLETACGRRPIGAQAPPEETVLVDWVWDRWGAGRWTEVVDPRLGSAYNREEAEVAVKVGLMCSQMSAAARPSMREVVRYLDDCNAAAVPEIPSLSTHDQEAVGFDDGSSCSLAGGWEEDSGPSAR